MKRERKINDLVLRTKSEKPSVLCPICYDEFDIDETSEVNECHCPHCTAPLYIRYEWEDQEGYVFQRYVAREIVIVEPPAIYNAALLYIMLS